MNAASVELTPRWRDRVLRSWYAHGWRGFHTLRRWLQPGVSGPSIRCRARSGACFLLDGSAYIDSMVLREGYYESEVLQALLAALREDGVLWDVGANFGLHAVSVACARPRARVVAFEPNPSELARLRAHAYANHAAVHAVPIALSDHPGRMTLHLGPPGNSGMSTLRAWSGLRTSGSADVAVDHGDALIARGELPLPTVLKIDVEGYEATVLRGLRQSLIDPRCTHVVFEDGASPDSEAKALLHAAGFHVHALQRLEQSAHALHNFIATKPGAAPP